MSNNKELRGKLFKNKIKVLKINLFILLLLGFTTGILINSQFSTMGENQSHDFMSTQPQSRADPNKGMNNWPPSITINTPSNPTGMLGYLNNKTVILEVTVEDPDDANATSFNGTSITTVEIYLTALTGVGDDWQQMTYNQSKSENASFNISRQEGIWHYWLNLNQIGPPAGNYLLWFNAKDNGLNGTGPFPGPFFKFNLTNLTLKVSQCNRAPRQRPHSIGGTFIYSNPEDSARLEFNLNDTVFYDDDVAFGPFPNTAPDSLSFQYLDPDGTTWRNGGFADFGNFIVQFNSSDIECIWVTPKANIYTLPAGEDLSFNCSDGDAWVIVDVTIIITSVNDAPVLPLANEWDYYNTNATYDDFDFTLVKTIQGLMVEIMINASDIDGDTLTYAIDDLEGFDPNTTALTDHPFDLDDLAMGMLNFTPYNDAVGTFIVNITVTDGTDTVYNNFSFEIANANDPPMITMVKGIAPTDHAVSLSATQGTLFQAVLTGKDIDVEDRALGDMLTFEADGTALDKLTNVTADYNFTPTNDDVGIMEVNFTVTDEGSLEDWVLATINIADINDPPKIFNIISDSSSLTIKNRILDLSDLPLTSSTPNLTLTIIAEDIDFYSVGETLSWSQRNVRISSLAYNLEKKNNSTLEVNFYGEKVLNGFHVLNITVKDDGLPSLGDWVLIKIKVNITDNNIEPKIPKPEIDLRTQNPKVYVEENLTIFGNVYYNGISDNNIISVTIMIINSEGFKLLKETQVNVVDGKFKYKFTIPEEVYGQSTSGTWIIITKLSDGERVSFDNTTLTIYPNPSDTSDDNDDGSYQSILGYGHLIDYLIFFIIGMVILIFIVSLTFILIRIKNKNLIQQDGLPSESKSQKILLDKPHRRMDESSIVTEIHCLYCRSKFPINLINCPFCGEQAPSFYYSSKNSRR